MGKQSMLINGQVVQYHWSSDEWEITNFKREEVLQELNEGSYKFIPKKVVDLINSVDDEQLELGLVLYEQIMKRNGKRKRTKATSPCRITRLLPQDRIYSKTNGKGGNSYGKTKGHVVKSGRRGI